MDLEMVILYRLYEEYLGLFNKVLKIYLVRKKTFLGVDAGELKLATTVF